MSADNGIYILKTKDQYRVAHFTHAEYMYYSIIESNYEDEIVPTRAIELWGDSKFTRKENVALHLAHKWENKLPFCEYGVNMIICNKTWEQIHEEAKDYAKKEIEFIEENEKERIYDMNKLLKIANGYYLAEYKENKNNQ